jgi:hypothetical protein
VRKLDSVRTLNRLPYLLINAWARLRMRAQCRLVEHAGEDDRVTIGMGADENTSSATAWPGLFRLPVVRRTPCLEACEGSLQGSERMDKKALHGKEASHESRKERQPRHIVKYWNRPDNSTRRILPTL